MLCIFFTNYKRIFSKGISINKLFKLINLRFITNLKALKNLIYNIISIFNKFILIYRIIN